MRQEAIPTISAEGWRTMDEATFRELATSLERGTVRTVVSPDAWRALEARATSLGIDFGAQMRVRRVQQQMLGR